MADKTEGKAVSPKAVRGERHSPWAHNLLYDVDSDGEQGSKVYLDKQVVFAVFLVL
jgi:hypothetical protein